MFPKRVFYVCCWDFVCPQDSLSCMTWAPKRLSLSVGSTPAHVLVKTSPWPASLALGGSRSEPPSIPNHVPRSLSLPLNSLQRSKAVKLISRICPTFQLRVKPETQPLSPPYSWVRMLPPAPGPSFLAPRSRLLTPTGSSYLLRNEWTVLLKPVGTASAPLVFLFLQWHCSKLKVMIPYPTC